MKHPRTLMLHTACREVGRSRMVMLWIYRLCQSRILSGRNPCFRAHLPWKRITAANLLFPLQWHRQDQAERSRPTSGPAFPSSTMRSDHLLRNMNPDNLLHTPRRVHYDPTTRPCRGHLLEMHLLRLTRSLQFHYHPSQKHPTLLDPIALFGLPLPDRSVTTKHCLRRNM